MNTAMRRKTYSERGVVNVSSAEGNLRDDVLSILQSIKDKQEKRQANIDSLLNQMSTVITTSQNFNRSRNYQNGPYNYCWLQNTNSHDILHCFTSMNIDKTKKLDAIRKIGVCFKCLQSGYTTRACRDRRACNETVSNGQLCGKLHHPKLQDIFIQPESADVSVHFSEKN